MHSLKYALTVSTVALIGLTSSAAWTVNNASSPTRITSEDGMILKVEVVSSSDRTLRISGVETLNDKTVLDLTPGVEEGWKVVAFKGGEGSADAFKPIVSLRAPLVEKLGLAAFSWRVNLKDVYLPSCTNVPEVTFNFCTALTNAVFSPKISTIGREAFYGCSELVSFSPMTLTKLTSLGSQAFANCSKLRGEWILDSPAITALPTGVFWTNKAVTNFVFRKSAVTALGDRALSTVAANGGSVYFYHTAPTLGVSAICATGNSKRLRIYVPNLAENEDLQERMAKYETYFNSQKGAADYPGPKTAGMILMGEVYSWIIPWTPPTALVLLVR